MNEDRYAATSSFLLGGQTAVITGGGRGLGAHMAHTLARAGAAVALLGRDQQTLKLVADSIAAEHRVETVALVADVSDKTALLAAADSVRAQLGRVDILVNNAGTLSSDSLLDTADDDWDRVIGTNLTGVWHAVRAFAPAMVAQGHGRIINIGSVMSGRAAANRGAYAASKAGLLNLTRTLAIELGADGITANCICPSVIVTDLNRTQIEVTAVDAYAQLLQRVPAGRWGKQEDLDGALLLFASPLSAYISGQALYIDGGLTAS